MLSSVVSFYENYNFRSTYKGSACTHFKPYHYQLNFETQVEVVVHGPVAPWLRPWKFLCLKCQNEKRLSYFFIIVLLF